MRHPASYISNHLLVFVTLSFIGGIGFSPLVYWPSQDISLLKIVLFTLTLFTVGFQLLQRTNLALFLLLPLSLCLGCYHTVLQLGAPAENDHIFQRITERTDMVLIGTMATMAGFDGRTSVVTIEAQHVRFQESTELLPTHGKILLRLQGPWPELLVPGDTLAVRTVLKRPESYRTPGAFDWARYLARKDVWITGFVKSKYYIHNVSEEHSILHRLRYFPERLRTIIGKQLDSSLPPEQAGLYRALLLGDRSGIDDPVLENFKGSGTFHILAISGIHVTVIGGMLYLLFYWLLSRSETLLLCFTIKKWALFFSLPILIVYGLLAGMNAPVFRAVLMSSILILSICTNRRKSPGPLLAAAALFILVLKPLQLFTVSFQLSFAAVTGILFILPSLISLLNVESSPTTKRPLHKKFTNWILALLMVSLVANLATLPIALVTFNRISSVGPFANLIIEPLICLWSLGTGFLAIPLLFISPVVSGYLLKFGGLGLVPAMKAASFFSSFSFSTIWLPNPPFWLVITYYICLLLFIFSIKMNKKNRWLICTTMTSLAISIVLFFQPIQTIFAPLKKPFKLSFLDVGQGTASFLQFPNGYKILIDGGGSSFSTATVGERLIAPFLWHSWINEIDSIIITHPDADHYNGLPSIVTRFKPKEIWLRDADNHNENFKKLLTLAQKEKVTLHTGQRGKLWQKNNSSIACIENTSAFLNEDISLTTRDRENSGLVIKACHGSFCALFPGDIGKTIEHILVERDYSLQAEILLAPHHGSDTSNSIEFLQAVAPDYLLVSAGRSSTGHFPHRDLEKECNELNIRLLNTARQGSIEITVDQQTYQLYGYQRVDKNNPLSPLQRLLLYQQHFQDLSTTPQ